MQPTLESNQEPTSESNQKPATADSQGCGCLSLVLGIIALAITYHFLVFLVNLFTGNLAWQQSPAQKREYCASAPERINSLNDREEIERIKAVMKAMDCASIEDEVALMKNGQNACNRFLESFANFTAKPGQKYENNGGTVFRTWFVKEKSSPVWSLAECRRDSTSNSSVLQYRLMDVKGKDEAVPVTEWSSGDDRVFYKNPDPQCVGLSISQCKKILRVEKPRVPIDHCEVAKALLHQRQRDFERWSDENTAAYAAGIPRSQLPAAPRIIDAIQLVRNSCP